MMYPETIIKYGPYRFSGIVAPLIRLTQANNPFRRFAVFTEMDTGFTDNHLGIFFSQCKNNTQLLHKSLMNKGQAGKQHRALHVWIGYIDHIGGNHRIVDILIRNG